MKFFSFTPIKSPKYDFLNEGEPSKTTLWKERTKINNAKQIASIGCSQPYFLVLKSINELELYSSTKLQIYELENEIIIDIRSGGYTFLILTESGKVYSLARYGKVGKYVDIGSEIPFEDPENSSFDQIRIVNFFSDNNIFVKDIKMGLCSNYFLCKGNKLYVSGKNNEGQLGTGTTRDAQLPILLCNNVSRIFSSNFMIAFYYITTDNKLFVCGNNKYGKLGINKNNKSNQLKEIKNLGIDHNDILDIQTSFFHSVLVTKSGKIYSCGSEDFNGMGKDIYTFTEMPFFKNRGDKIIRIRVGVTQTLVLNNNNEIFGFGFSETFLPKFQNNENKNQELLMPQKLKLPELSNTNPINFLIKEDCIFVYNTIETNTFLQDFPKFFKNTKYSDSTINLNNKNIKIHKLFIESRIGCKLDSLVNVLKKKFPNEITSFLKWIYFEDSLMNNFDLIKDIFTSLNLIFPPNENENSNDLSQNLKNYLLKLYNDQDSKDFFIKIMKNNNDHDGNDDDQKMAVNSNEKEKEKKEQKFDKIYVHKFILLARSGLFRSLYEFIENEKINEIKDYSKKSKKSLEILIKYLYTDKVELLDKHCNIELIIEELNDAIEYYQLNTNSKFKIQLNNLKK
ncbi:btk-binding protein-related [Anaeramoeba flamelloides]|uniref:Btk-binding protein-related n=1 Tax=Anaeramoeba flamelloides TaxID=1746091 RepID=A0AAV7YAT3_9EUKA|nr:btk-binding protein-related [Anaeramoeba flamelloides]